MAPNLPAFLALLIAVLAPFTAKAQPEPFVAPTGSMTWRYECKTECPSYCRVKGADLFAVSAYRTLTIVQVPKGLWVQLDTGRSIIDYVISEAEQVVCSATNATLIYARVQEPAKPK